MQDVQRGGLNVDLPISDTQQAGPSYADFIAMLKGKNPVGRRMSILVTVSNIPGVKMLYYTPDNLIMVDAIAAAKPIPAGLDTRVFAHDLSMPVDLSK